MKAILALVILFLVFLVGCRQNSLVLITPEKAEQLALDYVKVREIEWPTHNKVERYEGQCNFIVIDTKGLSDRSVIGCYFVYKSTNPKEIPGLGYEVIIVSLDGKQIGMGPLE